MKDRACLLATVAMISMAWVSGCSLPADAEGATLDDENATAEGEEASESALRGSDFPAPNLTAEEKATVLAGYHVDPNGVVPKALLLDAIVFFDHNKDKLKNRGFLTVVDFSKHSAKPRMFVVNMTSGAVASYVVAHGSGSDPGNTGIATRFSNVNDSNQSSLGFYITAETYNGKHGNSMRLDGVSETNSNARARAIVMHGADYVSAGRAKQGRSWGCLALSTAEKDGVIAKLKGGSVIYEAHPN